MQQIYQLSMLLVVFFLLNACGGSKSTSTPVSSSSDSSVSSSSSSGVTPPVVSASAGDGDITLSWVSLANAEGYHLYYATETGITPDNYASLDGGTWVQDVSSPFTIADLTNGTRYYLVVTAYNAGIESDASEQVDAMPVLPANLPTGLLNDTGIDWCTDDSYPIKLNCPVEGFEGQDGDQGRDAQARAGTLTKVGAGAAGFDFTKLDDAGESLPDDAEQWSCVRDNHTGLIWEVKTTDGGLRDMNSTYSWYNPDMSTNGGNTGTQNGGTCAGSACDTLAYLQAVNTQGLCGANDWQLPTKVDLMGIVDNGRVNPAIDTGYFPNTLVGWFWSSSPYAWTDSVAWRVDFSYGYVGNDLRSKNGPVRLVRAGE